ncbi:MAG: ATP-binding protein [Candidatus Pacebacteria bacterium]|nr:ATP-binding protein [Candidatus Paceibacterota bacterium]
MALIIGPRQTGKTTLLFYIYSKLKKQGKSCYFFSLEDPALLSKLDEHPDNLLKIIDGLDKNIKYVFIDEIQYLKNPSNFLKFHYDKYKGKIKLVVTGSSAFYIDKKFKDSLTGRKRIFFLNVFSFDEFLLSKKIKLKDLNIKKKEELMNIYITYGGYPRVILTDDEEKKMLILHEIAYSYTKRDIDDAGIQKDEIFYKLFVLLADQIGKTVNINELANTLGVSKTIINNFLYIMRKSFHVYLVNPYFKNLRKEITKMNKIYFNDFGLRNVILNNFDKLEHRDDKGEILENMIYKKLLETNDEITINY